MSRPVWLFDFSWMEGERSGKENFGVWGQYEVAGGEEIQIPNSKGSVFSNVGGLVGV